MKSTLKLAITVALLPVFAFANSASLNVEKDIIELKKQIKKLEQTIEDQNKEKSSKNKDEKVKEDNNYPTAKLSGSADLDAGYAKKISDNNKSGFAIRSLKGKVKGDIIKDLSYVFEVNFADNKVSINKANVSQKISPNKVITIGKLDEEFGLSYENKFIGQSILNSITKFTGNGIKYSIFGQQYYTAVSYTNTNFSDKSNVNDARTACFRGIYIPVQDDKNILAAGVSYSHNKPRNLKTKYTYAQNLETKLSENLLDHQERNIKHQNITGGDLIYVKGPFTIQGEYIGSRISKNNSKKLYFFGNYFQVSYSLTGENISYDQASGSFNGIKPLKPFDLSNNHYGAWEIAFRYSMLKLNSGSTKAGQMKAYSTSLNGYLNKNMNIKFNYITGKTDKNAAVPNARPKIYMVKLGLKF